MVDYCCYISSFEQNDSRIRAALWALGCKGYNVKLLKIHGSLNWLQCMNRQRLFTGFGDKLVLSKEVGSLCRHFKEHGFRVAVRSALIMPTFEGLMEARKIVFIGYSLPDADFEFRQLLSRMVHSDTEIEVVLWGEANSYQDEKKRCERFFAGKTISFELGGVQKFVSDLLEEDSFANETPGQ